MLLLFSALVDFAPRQVKVRDADHKVIGTALIPANDAGVIAFALIFFTLSGLQLWTIQTIIRDSRKIALTTASPNIS
ncbi:hypothetical protein BH09VER1_BH09VER1_04330 [soil metagenome]